MKEGITIVVDAHSSRYKIINYLQM